MSRCMFSLFLFVFFCFRWKNISKQCHDFMFFFWVRCGILFGDFFFGMTWDAPPHSDKRSHTNGNCTSWTCFSDCLTWGYSSHRYVIVYHICISGPCFKTTCQSGIVASPYVQNEKHQNSLMASPPRHRGIRWIFSHRKTTEDSRDPNGNRHVEIWREIYLKGIYH